MFTDLVGYTTLADERGDDHAADVALAVHALVRHLLPRYGATEVKSIGDGMMLRAATPAEAVPLGVAIVDAVDAAGWLPPVRVGVHAGPAVERSGDFFGTTVNIAARLCTAAGGGEVLASLVALRRRLPGRLRARRPPAALAEERVASRWPHVRRCAPRPPPAPASGAVDSQSERFPHDHRPRPRDVARHAAALGWTSRPIPLLSRLAARVRRRLHACRSPASRPWTILADPADVKQVFTGDPDVSAPARPTDPAAGRSATTRCCCSTAPRTCAQRKLLLPPFHGERMQRYGELMREIAEREVATWPRGRPFALPPRMQAVTLEVILRAVFGVPRGRAAGRAARRAARAAARADGRPRSRARCWACSARARDHAAPSSAAVLEPVDELLSTRSPRAATPATSRSATTSSRCCCRPATRTASR